MLYQAAALSGRSVFKDQAAQRSRALQAQIDLEKQAGAGDAEAHPLRRILASVPA